MRSIKINEALAFIKANNPAMQALSNNAVRTWIHHKLKQNTLYFIFKKGVMQAIIEWYRYPDVMSLVADLKRPTMTGQGGVVLYVNSIMSAGAITLQQYKIFLNFLKRTDPIQVYFRLTYKNNQYGHKRVF